MCLTVKCPWMSWKVLLNKINALLSSPVRTALDCLQLVWLCCTLPALFAHISSGPCVQLRPLTALHSQLPARCSLSHCPTHLNKQPKCVQTISVARQRCYSVRMTTLYGSKHNWLYEFENFPNIQTHIWKSPEIWNDVFLTALHELNSNSVYRCTANSTHSVQRCNNHPVFTVLTFVILLFHYCK